MAAAAILAAAFLGWSALTPSGDITLSERRTQLVASAQDVLSLEWTATEDSAATGASGDVAWSSAEQAGYMRFRGLKANDPTVTQYQLWVFDAKRDERYPVDGGVFDIPTDATEIVVPIAAKIFVSQPTLFAVTVEAPGGVVVSSRERIVLLAAL